MSKLKNIIKQLSPDDYHHIYNSLVDSEATKSADLLKHLREKRLTDKNIMQELDVNVNAFYTLRSRLNQKIEEFLLRQMQSPRTDLLKKVANINEIIFTKKRDIAIATLKKLEKELKDYDLTNELTIVYKALKKLHINTPDYYSYSQLYNKHIAFNLAVDKAEELLGEYFQKYGEFIFTGDKTDKFRLYAIADELENVCNIYKSHRLFVYKSAVKIFHKLTIAPESIKDDDEPIEDTFRSIEHTFETYYLDSIYYNLKLVFEYLKLMYYNHYKVFKKAELHYQEVNQKAMALLANYNLFTFPGLFFSLKIERHLRLGTQRKLFNECNKEFAHLDINYDDIPNTLLFTNYVALSCYYAGKNEQGLKLTSDILGNLNYKKYPKAHLEVKLLQLLLNVQVKDKAAIMQNVNSIQRIIRIVGKEECKHASLFIKILKTTINNEIETKSKFKRIENNIKRLEEIEIPLISPIRHIAIDETFIARIVEK